ncbi:hypothetical protein CPAR01_12096 [Colletotrichum paranaense]|uniref:Uncharacterized protein n=1 Tax=Colletotrichum paranaense TaxID=1914294 RepID=A0ABQ9S910_9PEZI|nr:uncharacterized protein CPAR01_12096 [Colletotrichum paranaense]KAK1529784.1 hypothetical protein CPAR01_12096 [Colletotrichum paranaense]
MGDLPPEADGDIGESRVKQLDLIKVLVQKISVAVKASCYWEALSTSRVLEDCLLTYYHVQFAKALLDRLNVALFPLSTAAAAPFGQFIRRFRSGWSWLAAEALKVGPFHRWTPTRGGRKGAALCAQITCGLRDYGKDKSPALPASACKCGDGLVWEFCQ